MINESFPTAQFEIDGLHKPLRQDVTNKSDGLLVYVRLYLSLLQLTKHIIGHATVCLWNKFEKGEVCFPKNTQASFVKQLYIFPRFITWYYWFLFRHLWQLNSIR